MADWIVAAEGKSLDELTVLISDRELKKGDQVKLEFDTDHEWVFDAAGAEHAFKSKVPEGMELIDVYGEGGKGIVLMEADPAWLVAVVGFAKAHWLVLTIVALGLSFLLPSIIKFVRVLIKVAGPLLEWGLIILVIAGLAIIGLSLYSMVKGRVPT